MRVVSRILLCSVVVASTQVALPAPADSDTITINVQNVTDLSRVPNPLGLAKGVLETAQAQNLGTFFGFTAADAAIVESELDTPEPAAWPLLLGAIVLIVVLHRRGKRRA